VCACHLQPVARVQPVCAALRWRPRPNRYCDLKVPDCHGGDAALAAAYAALLKDQPIDVLKVEQSGCD